MVDSKTMNDQIHEFKNLVQQLKANGSTPDETFHIACLIDKLTHTCTEFAKQLSQTQGDLTLRGRLFRVKLRNS